MAERTHPTAVSWRMLLFYYFSRSSPSSPHTCAHNMRIHIRHVLIKVETTNEQHTRRRAHIAHVTHTHPPTRRVYARAASSGRLKRFVKIVVREIHLDNFGDCSSKNLTFPAKFGFI